MAKKKSTRTSKKAGEFSLSLEGAEARWARSIQRLAKTQGKSLEDVMREALREWLWHASGLKRMFRQVRESSDLMTRSFQVQGMLVGLAKSGGISLGQQTEYLRRAQEERAQYNEDRKKITRLVREIRRLANETGLPSAIEAGEKLVLPN